MASILFLAPDDLAETVLASGALAHVLGPDDDLTVVGGPALFRAAPAARVTAAPTLGLSAFAQVFDIAIDARGDLASILAPARRRLSPKPNGVVRHLSELWAAAAGAERPLAPTLWLDEAARRDAAEACAEAAPLIVLAPGGSSAAKRWPADRFADAARRLACAASPEAQVVVLGAGARDAAITRAICDSLDADGVAAHAPETLDLLAAAALMQRATLCLGNDNVLTHIAAAMGAPTLALFGPTDERMRAPIGPRTRLLRATPRAQILALGLDGGDAMLDIGVDAVEASALELLSAGGLR